VKYNRHNLSIWIFRLFVAVGCGLMIASFSLPWWQVTQMDIQGLLGDSTISNPITIYGFGLRHNLVELGSRISGDVTPLYQTILAWVYIAVSICLALISTRLKGMKGTLLLGSIGLCYIVYAVTTNFIVVSNRMAELGFALQGTSSVFMDGSFITMHSEFAQSYYLAFSAGGIFIILALIRQLLISKLNRI
jgi:hypothetical protein